MGFKLILTLLIVFGVYILIRRAMQNQGKTNVIFRQKEPEEMVQCRYCGTFLPRSEAFIDGQHHFCSKAHIDAEKNKETDPP